MYQNICDHFGISEEKRYWDQSVAQLEKMVNEVSDVVLHESFDKRLQNYVYLSANKPPEKSNLFSKVK